MPGRKTTSSRSAATETTNHFNAMFNTGPVAAFPMATASLRGLQMMTHLNAHMMMRMLELNRHCMDFVDQRLRKDIDFSDMIVGGSAPADFLKSMADFYQTAFEDYTKQASEITKQTGDAAAVGMAEAEEEMQRTLEKNAAT